MENSIVELEFDIRTKKMEQGRGRKIVKRFQKELELKQTQKQEIEKEIDDLGKNRKWLDWVEKYGEDIRLNLSNETKQKEFLNGILNKIVVRSEYEGKDKQQGHSFDFYFKMKIIDDTYEVIDKNAKPRRYRIKQGRDVDKSDGIVKFVIPRNDFLKKSKKK